MKICDFCKSIDDTKDIRTVTVQYEIPNGDPREGYKTTDRHEVHLKCWHKKMEEEE